MKFDVIIGNPPYKGNLHLDFMKQAVSMSKRFVLWLAPATWMLSEKQNAHSTYDDIKELTNGKIKSVKLINGNKLFGIGSFIPLAFTAFDLSGNKNKIKVEGVNGESWMAVDCEHISERLQNPVYLSLREKILGYIRDNNSLLAFRKHTNEESPTKKWFVSLPQIRGNVVDNKPTKKWFVSLPQIRGHVHVDNKNDEMYQYDFFTMTTKDDVVQDAPTKHIYFEFDTKDEATNFLLYTRAFFARFALSIYKNTSQLDRGELASVPWVDFSKSWTDDKLRKYFRITESEWEYIQSTIPEYYNTTDADGQSK